MSKKEGKGVAEKEGMDFGIGGFFKGLTGLVEKLGELAEKGQELRKTVEIRDPGSKDGVKGICGFSVKVGLGGEDVKVEPFGNIRKDEASGQAVVQEVREPMVDILEEKDHVLVVAEMPGIGSEDVKLEVKDDVLSVIAEKGDKKYRKEILLPGTPGSRDLKYIGSLLAGLPVQKGDRIRAMLFGSRWADFKVDGTAPQGPVLIQPTTQLQVAKTKELESTRSISYEDIGGLRPQLQRVREMIELPLRYPEVFERLGIDAPKGVLLYGPPGCGKTLIARAIAHETEANFFSINGPEIIHKFYGESEAHLRQIFEKATSQAPSIVFLDEIDAIAPRREKVVGDVEKRVVAQLLALMDGLTKRQHVIVIAATNIPNVLDPALRRPGRFDREISIPIPDRNGRLEILEIYSRGMPLASDVDMGHLAEITHGFVGADLEALCREAAMICLRRLMHDIDFAMASIPYEQLAQLEVYMDDFMGALREVEPSAIREVFVEVPDVRWDDVGGLSDTKERLMEAVEWPLKFPQVFEEAGVRPPKGILLSGPPGCGKTMLAKAIATESEVNFISVKGPALLSMYVGESEKAVREVFQKARHAAPCIVFFDEIDALVPTRSAGSSDSHVSERVLSQFLAELDGVEELKGVLVLGATNRFDMLDPAVLRPGRFDELIEISPPDEEGRAAIFEVHLRGKPLAKGIDVKDLAGKTEGFSGADIAGACHRAARSAVRRVVQAMQREEGKKPPPLRIAREDLLAAISEEQ